MFELELAFRRLFFICLHFCFCFDAISEAAMDAFYFGRRFGGSGRVEVEVGDLSEEKEKSGDASTSAVIAPVHEFYACDGCGSIMHRKDARNVAFDVDSYFDAVWLENVPSTEAATVSRGDARTTKCPVCSAPCGYARIGGNDAADGRSAATERECAHCYARFSSKPADAAGLFGEDVLERYSSWMNGKEVEPLCDAPSGAAKSRP